MAYIALELCNDFQSFTLHATIQAEVGDDIPDARGERRLAFQRVKYRVHTHNSIHAASFRMAVGKCTSYTVACLLQSSDIATSTALLAHTTY